MKSLLLMLALFIGSSFSFSQTLDTNSVYNDEWYESLDEPVNFITFKDKCEVTIQFRIYRGQEEFYNVTLTNSNGVAVYEGRLKQVDEIDVSNVYEGVYTITACDDEGNSITKTIIIG